MPKTIKKRTIMDFNLEELKLINHGLCAACMETENDDYYDRCDKLNERFIAEISRITEIEGSKSDE